MESGASEVRDVAPFVLVWVELFSLWTPAANVFCWRFFLLMSFMYVQKNGVRHYVWLLFFNRTSTVLQNESWIRSNNLKHVDLLHNFPECRHNVCLISDSPFVSVTLTDAWCSYFNDTDITHVLRHVDQAAIFPSSVSSLSLVSHRRVKEVCNYFVENRNYSPICP